jgi:N-acetylglucosaminyl-diphospho-decaprenol L-rhamnosyltransferase
MPLPQSSRAAHEEVVRIVAMAEWPVNAPGGLPRNYAASTGCAFTLASLPDSFTFQPWRPTKWLSIGPYRLSTRVNNVMKSETRPANVAVITVSYNSSAQLEAFLTSAVATVRNATQILVVDNASSDIESTRSLTKKYGARLLELLDNRGYGGAVNAGVLTLDTSVDFVVVANPDLSFQPNAVAQLVEAAAADPRVATTGPRVLNVDGTSYPSARSIPSLRAGIGHALFANLWPTNPWTRSYHSNVATGNEQIAVGWLSGSCVCVRRTAFEAVGGFDEEFFMYFEDVDLGYRLGKLGFINVFVPHAEVTHIGGLSTAAHSREMLRVHHDSAYRFLSKKYPGALLAPLRWILRLALTTRVALSRPK